MTDERTPIDTALESMQALLERTQAEIVDIEQQIAQVDVLRRQLVDRKHAEAKLAAAIKVMQMPDPPVFRTQALPTTDVQFYYRIIGNETMKFADLYATACRDLGLEPTSELATLLKRRMGTQLKRAAESGALLTDGEAGGRTYRANPHWPRRPAKWPDAPQSFGKSDEVMSDDQQEPATA